MLNTRFAMLVPAALVALFACSSQEDTRAQICQVTAKHLLGNPSEISFGASKTIEQKGDHLRVDITFAASGADGQASCFFPVDETKDDTYGEQGYTTSPTRMTLNDRPVDDVELMKVTATAVTGEILKDSAEATSKAAQEAGHKAVEVVKESAEAVKDAAAPALEQVKKSLQQ